MDSSYLTITHLHVESDGALPPAIASDPAGSRLVVDHAGNESALLTAQLDGPAVTPAGVPDRIERPGLVPEAKSADGPATSTKQGRGNLGMGSMHQRCLVEVSHVSTTNINSATGPAPEVLERVNSHLNLPRKCEIGTLLLRPLEAPKASPSLHLYRR